MSVDTKRIAGIARAIQKEIDDMGMRRKSVSRAVKGHLRMVYPKDENAVVIYNETDSIKILDDEIEPLVTALQMFLS